MVKKMVCLITVIVIILSAAYAAEGDMVVLPDLSEVFKSTEMTATENVELDGHLYLVYDFNAFKDSGTTIIWFSDLIKMKISKLNLDFTWLKDVKWLKDNDPFSRNYERWYSIGRGDIKGFVQVVGNDYMRECHVLFYMPEGMTMEEPKFAWSGFQNPEQYLALKGYVFQNNSFGSTTSGESFQNQSYGITVSGESFQNESYGDLSEAVKDAMREANRTGIPQKVLCECCNGTRHCNICGGLGWVRDDYEPGKRRTCDYCDGGICKVCDGSGYWWVEPVSQNIPSKSGEEPAY